MPTVNVYNLSKEKVGELTLNEAIFNRPVEPHLLHRVVTMQAGQPAVGHGGDQGPIPGPGRRQKTFSPEGRRTSPGRGEYLAPDAQGWGGFRPPTTGLPG